MSKLTDIRFGAVLAGALADNAGTLLIMTTLAALLVASGLPEDEVMARMKNTNGLLLGLIIGLCCTVGGGYLAGRVSGREEVLHGILVAACGMVLALITRESGTPLWFDLAGFGGMLPAGVFGGYLALRRRAGVK